MYLQNFVQEKSWITDSSTLDINNRLKLKERIAFNYTLEKGLEKGLLEHDSSSDFENQVQINCIEVLEESHEIEKLISPTVTSIPEKEKKKLSNQISTNVSNKKITKSLKISEKNCLVNHCEQYDSSLQNNTLSLLIPFIPKIVEQFLSENWFRDLFPNLNSQTFPSGCSTSSCFSIIFSACSNNRVHHPTTGALHAILLLDRQSYLSQSEKECISELIIDKLLFPTIPIHFPPNKEFKFDCLSVLNKFCSPNSIKYISSLLVIFLRGDLETRRNVLNYLKCYGLSDPFQYLTRELDSWDIESLETPFDSVRLLNYTIDWLKKLINTIINFTNPFEHISSKSNTTSFPTCIEALNNLVKQKTQLELKSGIIITKQRTLSPVPVSVDPKLKSVVSFPKICSVQKVIRMGETHNSQCHAERETTLINFKKSSLMGMMDNRTSQNLLLHIPVHLQNLTLSQSNQSSVIVEPLQLKRKYFQLTQSQLL